MKEKPIDVNEIYDGSPVEKWITPDIFIWHGRKWEIKPNCQIVEITEALKETEG